MLTMHRTLLFVFMLAASYSVDAQYADVATVQISGGPSFDYPAHWTVLDYATTENIAHSVKGVTRSVGVDLSNIKKEGRIAIVSQPLPSAAKIRGFVVSDSDILESTFQSLTAQDILEIKAEWEVEMAKVSEAMKSRIDSLSVELKVYSGRTSLVIAYNRSGESAGEKWHVEQIKIPFKGGYFGLTTSFLMSQESVMAPILEEVKQSVKF